LKNALKNTWKVLVDKEKKRFVILCVLDVLISVLDIISLALLLAFIQAFAGPASGSPGFLPHWITNKDPLVFLSFFIFLFGFKNMAGFYVARSQYRFVSGVAVRISARKMQNYQQAEFDEFIQTDSSVQIRRIGFQPFDFCQYLLSGFQQLITQSILILLTITAIILFNAKLFLLLLTILLPPVIIVFYFIKKRLSIARARIQQSNERSFQFMLDALKGYVEGNIYNRNDFFLNRFLKSRKIFSTHLFYSLNIQNLPSRIIEVFAILGLFILILIAKWTGDTAGTLITIGAFLAAAYKIIPGMVKVINISGQIKGHESSVADLVNETENDEPIVDAPAIQLLALKNISFNYGDAQVLKNFELTAEKGDMVGLTGRSGKGKTTILNLVLGFLAPDQGTISINNKELRKNELKKYWPSISYVRQQSFLIHDTVLRNITLEEDKYDKEKLDTALKISGLDELLLTYEEGLQKIITENGKNISGGQQQRIALARALYKDADLILLDEPFNELDETSEILMLEHFRELAKKGKIVIMITHDKKSLSYCTKTISLDGP
jgi:ABC-type multidrug transport system fused ATPase/permease subunit